MQLFGKEKCEPTDHYAMSAPSHTHTRCQQTIPGISNQNQKGEDSIALQTSTLQKHILLMLSGLNLEPQKSEQPQTHHPD